MSSLDPELLEAVLSSDVQLLITTLTRGVDVNTLTESGISLLGKAIQIGNEDIIQILIDAKHFLPNNNMEWKRTYDDQFFDLEILQGIKEVEFKESCVQIGQTKQKDCKFYDCQNHHGLHLYDHLRSHSFQRHGCDVNLPDFFDRMPIHYAAETGNINVFQKLISAGGKVNVSDNNNITPLHLAVSFKYEAIVELLLKAGSRVNSKTSDKCSALHIACSRGFLSIVQLLLKYDAYVDVFDSSERTPLFVAVMRSHHDIVRLLLFYGAKINTPELHGYTPLCEAVWHNDQKLLELLLNAGAKISEQHNLVHHAIRHRSLKICELLLHHGAFPDYRNDSGEAPIHIAVETVQIEFVRIVLKYGASANIKSGASGKSPIHIAVDKIPEEKIDVFVEMLQLLLNYGANLNSETFTTGDTALYTSILLDKFIFSEELIRHGSDPNLGHVFSCQIDNLSFAARKGNFHLVKLLMYSGFKFSSVKATLEFLKNAENHKHIFLFLQNFINEPLSLLNICRINIRRTMKYNIIDKLEYLNLPNAIKDYLLLKGQT